MSNLEKSAYLENVYDQNPTYERIVRDIASKDFESFKDRFDLDVNWHLMNTAYDIPFLKKFRSPREFIDYSAEELRTQSYAMDQEELFTGLREGLKLMKTGETITFIFPSQKAYGYYGDDNKISSNMPLVCEVTVNSITQIDSN